MTYIQVLKIQYYGFLNLCFHFLSSISTPSNSV